MAEDFMKVVERRIKTQHILTLYEHEIDKYLDASLYGDRGTAEALIRAGMARHNGVPIRVHQQETSK